MNHTDVLEFNQAVALAGSGRKNEAHEQLAQLLRNNETDSNLLLWLVFTAGDLMTARFFLNKLAERDPYNPNLPGAQEWLKQEEAKQSNPLAEEALLASYYSGEVTSKRREQIRTIQRPLPEHAAVSVPTDAQTPTSTAKPNGGEEVLVAKEPEYASTGDAKGWQYKLIALLVGVVVVVLIASLVLYVVLLGDNGSKAKNEPEGDRVAAQGVPVYPGLQRIVFTPADRQIINNKITQNVIKTLPSNGALATVVFEAYRVPAANPTPASVSARPEAVVDRQAIFNFYNLELRRTAWEETHDSTAYVPSYLQVTKNVTLGARSTGFEYLDLFKLGVQPLTYNISASEEIIMVVFYQVKYSNDKK